MAKIDLPHYHWLVSKHEGRFVTNTYSGSMGTLPDQGCGTYERLTTVFTWTYQAVRNTRFI